MQNPACSYINLDCTRNPRCAAQTTGKPCWSLAHTACCKRRDKTRCVWCSVYIEFLGREKGPYTRRPMISSEPDSFATANREFYRRTGHRLSDPIVLEEGQSYEVAEDGSVVVPEGDEE